MDEFLGFIFIVTQQDESPQSYGDVFWSPINLFTHNCQEDRKRVFIVPMCKQRFEETYRLCQTEYTSPLIGF
jgi:hypothetical protein